MYIMLGQDDYNNIMLYSTNSNYLHTLNFYL